MAKKKPGVAGAQVIGTPLKVKGKFPTPDQLGWKGPKAKPMMAKPSLQKMNVKMSQSTPMTTEQIAKRKKTAVSNAAKKVFGGL